MRDEIVHKELSGIIIGAAITVLNELKPGLDEKLYGNELSTLNIRAHPRHPRLNSNSFERL
jgi:hypothetical protein